MGRWSQQRRRGGGGETAAAPPVGVSIVSVAGQGGALWQLTFDGPIVTSGTGDDAGFFVGDATLFSCTGSGGVLANGVDDGTSGYTPGQPWTLASQPAWLVTPIAGPQTGFTV